jgi:hypothetical protein
MLCIKPRRRIGLPIWGWTAVSSQLQMKTVGISPLLYLLQYLVTGWVGRQIAGTADKEKSLEFCLVNRLLSGYCVGLGDSLEWWRNCEWNVELNGHFTAYCKHSHIWLEGLREIAWNFSESEYSISRYLSSSRNLVDAISAQTRRTAYHFMPTSAIKSAVAASDNAVFGLTICSEQSLLKCLQVFSYSSISHHFVESEVLLPSAQEPATCPYPEPVQPSPRPSHRFLQDPF